MKRIGFCALILVPVIVLLAYLPSANTKRMSDSVQDVAITDTCSEENSSVNESEPGKFVVPQQVSEVVLSSHLEWNSHFRQKEADVESSAAELQSEEVKTPAKLDLSGSTMPYPTTSSGRAFSSRTFTELPEAQDHSQVELTNSKAHPSNTNTKHSPGSRTSDMPAIQNSVAADPTDSLSQFEKQEIASQQKDQIDDTLRDSIGQSNPLRGPLARNRTPIVFEQSNDSAKAVSQTNEQDRTHRQPESTLRTASDKMTQRTSTPPTPNANQQFRANSLQAEPARTENEANEPHSANTQPAPRVAAVTRSGEETNPIRNSVSPENYSFSERKSDPTAAENDWHKRQTNQQISGTLWWAERAKQPLRNGTTGLPIDLDSLLIRALQHSAQIRVFTELPLIRDTAVTEASANFDWSAFMETLWNDTSDPVGSTLTTGGSPRFNSHKINASTGLRRRNMSGGQIEFAQELGFENNNSNFFLPNDQGTARLRMSYSHPLLRGGGRYYNQSLIVLAQVDSNVARDELERQVEGHLLEVTRAYWGLALERAAYLQLVRLFERSSEIRDKLVGRQGLDSYRSQIVRADSAVSSREAALIRAEVAVRNAEARVRALVNDPEFADEHLIEIIPTDDPIDYEITSDLKEVLLVAMQKRSEIQQSFKQIKAAGVRKEMTKNELLPTLNMVMNSYLSGLQGNSDVTQAWVDQFSLGAPSYGVGFEFDVPVANRAAKARHLRRRLELRQFESQLRLTMETVNLEVGVAVRESNASYKEMQAKYRAMVAASEDAEFVKQRWELLPGDHQNASLVFDDLLRTQQRLTDAENEFLRAQTTYNLSLTNIKKAAGILLEAERIETREVQNEYAPEILFERSNPASGEQYEIAPSDQSGLNQQSPGSQVGTMENNQNERSTLTESDFPIPVVESLNQNENQSVTSAPEDDPTPVRTFFGMKPVQSR